MPSIASWYFGATMKTLLCPVPSASCTTAPPSTCGPANGRSADGAGAFVGSTIDAKGSSKYSRQLFAENAA